MGDSRVLLGKKGSEYGLWVSKEGVPVTTASNDELLFDSSRAEGSLIIKSGTATGGTWYSWGTTLNYIPLIFIWQGKTHFPVRKGAMQGYNTGGRYGTTYRVIYEKNLIATEATTTQFRVNAAGTYRYAAFSIGGSSIISVGP